MPNARSGRVGRPLGSTEAPSGLFTLLWAAAVHRAAKGPPRPLFVGGCFFWKTVPLAMPYIGRGTMIIVSDPERNGHFSSLCDGHLAPSRNGGSGIYMARGDKLTFLAMHLVTMRLSARLLGQILVLFVFGPAYFAPAIRRMQFDIA